MWSSASSPLFSLTYTFISIPVGSSSLAWERAIGAYAVPVIVGPNSDWHKDPFDRQVVC